MENGESEVAFPIVGIGASAGGLSAFEHFFRGLPEDPRMAFVLVQHLAPHHESELAELLQTHTSMRVMQVEDGATVEVNRVYVIPPGKTLSIRDGALHLSEPAQERGARIPIDHFFRSLAEDQRENAVCIVLSGTGTDGTLGLKAVKEAGGLTMVQLPDDAEYDGMPRSAQATGLVDVVATAGELAEKLHSFRKSASRIQLPEEEEGLPEDEHEAFSRVLTQVRERTGHDFSHYKRATILRRITRRLQVRGIDDIPAYLSYLRTDPQEAHALFKDFLISVTNFFRDRESFEALEKKIVPKIVESKDGEDRVRVWVPGCATGEEAYSIAILVCERLRERDGPTPELQIFATDMDDDALAFAREGLYPAAISADVSPERLERFFTKEGGGYRVRKELKELVLFASHNLIKDPGFSRLDLISCRNLLIYLEREVQERVLSLFHYALRDGGYLFLGSSESVEAAPKLFTAFDKRNRLFRPRGGVQPGRFPPMPSPAPARQRQVESDRSDSQEPSLASRHVRHVLERHTMPTLLVDSDYEILHVVGGAGRYLFEADGVPSENLVEKVHPDLRLDLRTALYQAVHHRKATQTRHVPLERDGRSVLVRMRVEPVALGAGPPDLVEVIFEETEAREGDGGDAGSLDVGDGRDVAHQLEEELRRTRERLQTTIEEYETSNEELKASNEELQSMNEELQSTTEELETSKEELQSMNEELVTVNQELRNKIDELARANSDLQNLMASTDVCTVFLDRDMRIKRFTPRAEDVFNLIPGDVGRPFAHVAHNLGQNSLGEEAKRVLKRLSPYEAEIEGHGGRWYILRILPYRTVDDSIDGVVVTAVDVTAWRKAEEQVRFQAEILGHISDLVVALDVDGRVTYMNDEAGRRLRLDPVDATGRPRSELYRYRWLHEGDEDEAMEALARTGRWRGESVLIPARGEEIIVDSMVVDLDDEQGRRTGRMAVMRDVTARVRAQQELADSEERFRSMFESSVVPMAFWHVDGRVLDANDAYLELIEATREDLETGRIRWDRLTPPEWEDQDAAVLDEIAATSAFKPVEKEYRTLKGNRIPILLAGATLPGSDDTGVSVVLDRRDRQRAEEALREAALASERASRAKSAFLARVSHELRTPLNAVVGYADLMDEGIPVPVPDEALEHVDRIRVSASHLLHLIEEILEFTRSQENGERVHVRDVTLENLLGEVETVARPMAEKAGLELVIDAAGGPERLRTDDRKLRHILSNLVGNAAKFTREGRIDLAVDTDDHTARFHVHDTGPGIPSEALERIFEPFSQEGDEGAVPPGGTGLGLAISRHYASLIGGRLTVTSEPGVGSTFTLEIPTTLESDGEDDQGE